MATRRTWTLLLVAVSVTFTLGGCGGQSPGVAVGFGNLEAMARNMAASAEDSQVRTAEAVLTTSEASGASSPGSPGNPNEPAFLVQMHGTFIGRDASVPQNGHLPTGAYMIFVVDASTGMVIEWGIQDRASNLAALGTVIPLSW